MFERLLPVLPVAEVDAEVAFYAALGFTAAPTHTGFTALRSGQVLFGVQRSEQPVPPAGLAWQIEVTDIRAVHELAVRAHLPVVRGPQVHPVGFWTVQLRTPSGYLLTFEGPRTAN